MMSFCKICYEKLKDQLKILFLPWSTLSRIGNSKIFKTSFIWLFLIPLIAKLLNNIESISFLLNEEIYKFDLSLSFSFQMLFFSAVFATIGQILYITFAPSIISNYSNYNEFQDEGKGELQLKSEYRRMIKNKCGNNLKATLLEVITLADTFGGKVLNSYAPKFKQINTEKNDLKSVKETLFKLNALVTEIGVHDKKQGQLFWYIRDNLDQEKHNIRLYILFFYGLSFLTLGLIAVENIYYVTTQSNLNMFEQVFSN